ncbi:hypothetical protein LCGC14_0812970 [marine sediment metagenome]|uniref:Uncharacterized protein n=1 Tax=marine sediment metagenome TaxID=412755 RepID=A0A0F9Q6B9_9ZZZZ
MDKIANYIPVQEYANGITVDRQLLDIEQYNVTAEQISRHLKERYPEKEPGQEFVDSVQPDCSCLDCVSDKTRLERWREFVNLLFVTVA